MKHGLIILLFTIACSSSLVRASECSALFGDAKNPASMSRFTISYDGSTNLRHRNNEPFIATAKGPSSENDFTTTLEQEWTWQNLLLRGQVPFGSELVTSHGIQSLIETSKQTPIVRQMIDRIAEKSVVNTASGMKYREYYMSFIRMKNGDTFLVEATSNHMDYVDPHDLYQAYQDAGFPKSRGEARRQGKTYYASATEGGLEYGTDVAEVIQMHSHPPVAATIGSRSVVYTEAHFSMGDFMNNKAFAEDIAAKNRGSVYSNYLVPIFESELTGKIAMQWQSTFSHFGP